MSHRRTRSVSASRKRSRRADAGQALAEYGILLALMAGVSQLKQLTSSLLAEPSKTLLIGAAVVIAIAYVFTSARGRS